MRWRLLGFPAVEKIITACKDRMVIDFPPLLPVFKIYLEVTDDINILEPRPKALAALACLVEATDRAHIQLIAQIIGKKALDVLRSCQLFEIKTRCSLYRLFAALAKSYASGVEPFMGDVIQFMVYTLKRNPDFQMIANDPVTAG